MIEPLLDRSIIPTAKRAECIFTEWVERGKTKMIFALPKNPLKNLFTIFASTYDCSKEIQNLYNEFTIPLHGHCILVTSKLKDHIYTYEYDFVDAQAIMDFDDLGPLTI